MLVEVKFVNGNSGPEESGGFKNSITVAGSTKQCLELGLKRTLLEIKVEVNWQQL